MQIEVDRRDLGRILSALRERQRKFKKGIDKWGDDFDPVLGASMIEGYESYTQLIRNLQNVE